MTPELHRLMREGIGALVSGHLPEADTRALEAHLADCAECRVERDGLLEVMAALRVVDPDRLAEGAPEPRPELLHRIMTQTVGSPAKGDFASPQGPQRRAGHSPLAGDDAVFISERRPRPIGRALQALAAALVLLAVGVGIGSQVFPRAAPGAPFETVAFEQAPPGVDASGRLIAHTWGTEIQLIVTGLEDGQEYRASFFDADGVEIDGGTFIGVQGPMVCNLNAAILRPDVTMLRITTDAEVPVLEADLTASSG